MDGSEPVESSAPSAPQPRIPVVSAPVECVPVLSAPATTCVELKDLSKLYQLGDETVHALDHVDLTIRHGEHVAIIGPSGSGKSTMLQILGCLDSPTSGSYVLDGDAVGSLSESALAEVRNTKIGFIFQTFNLIPDLNVFDNIDVPLRYRGMRAAARRRAIEECLGIVGLSARMKHHPTQLSGGQQQRVAIARALVGQPRLILADEPTGNLDSEMAAQILSLLKEINTQGTTIVMVTHDAELAAHAHRIVHIRDGAAVEGVELDALLATSAS